MRSLIAVAILTGLIICGTDDLAFGSEPVTATNVGARKINLAGRQRMLVQRMGKSACFASQNVDVAMHRQELAESQDLFESTLKALKFGSAELGLAPESDDGVLRQLQAVEQFWTSYDRVLRTMLSSDTFKIDQLHELGLQLVEQANFAVTAIEAKYEGAGLIEASMAGAINLWGRQRMLSQKMTFEYCLLFASIKTEEVQPYLIGSMALFDSKHEELDADFSRIKSPKLTLENLQSQWNRIGLNWTLLKTHLERALGTAKISSEDALQVSRISRQLLAEINQGVERYAQAVGHRN
jgi:hypothetical protein